MLVTWRGERGCSHPASGRDPPIRTPLRRNVVAAWLLRREPGAKSVSLPTFGGHIRGDVSAPPHFQGGGLGRKAGPPTAV